MNLFDICKKIKIQNEDPIDSEDTFEDFLEDDEAADVIQSINFVNNSICNNQDWNFRERRTTFQTVISQDEYTKPFGKIWKLKHEGQVSPLVEIHYDYIIDNPQSGTPYNYAFYADKLVLYPTPIEAKIVTAYFYTNNFAKKINQSQQVIDAISLENETDYSIIPAHLHDILVYGACIEHYKKPSREKSILWQARFNQLMSDFESASRNSVNEYGRIIFGERPKDIIQDFFDPRK